MGYESKIFFYKAYAVPAKGDIGYSEIVAMVDMCKMGVGYTQGVTDFVNLFDKETPFSLHLAEYDEEGREILIDTTEDRHGKRLCYGDPTALYEKIKGIAETNEYWRFKILRDMLKAFKDNPEVYVVHYGY